MNATNLRGLVELYIYKKRANLFLWLPTTISIIDLISQTDRKGGRCIPVKILSIEHVFNTLTMGAGTHVIIGPESDHWECLSVTHSLTN